MKENATGSKQVYRSQVRYSQPCPMNFGSATTSVCGLEAWRSFTLSHWCLTLFMKTFDTSQITLCLIQSFQQANFLFSSFLTLCWCLRRSSCCVSQSGKRDLYAPLMAGVIMNCLLRSKIELTTKGSLRICCTALGNHRALSNEVKYHCYRYPLRSRFTPQSYPPSIYQFLHFDPSINSIQVSMRSNQCWRFQ